MTQIDETLELDEIETPTLDPAEAKEILRKEVNEKGLSAIRSVTPLAFKFEIEPQTSDEAMLLDPLVRITPVMNPLFEAIAVYVIGAKKLGDRSIVLGVEKKSSAKPVKALLEVLPAGCVVHNSSHFRDVAKKRGLKNAREDVYYSSARDIARDLITEIEPMKRANENDLVQLIGTERRPTDAAGLMQGIVTVARGKIYVKFVTVAPWERPRSSWKRQPLNFGIAGCPDLDLFEIAGTKSPVTVTLDVAAAIYSACRDRNVPTVGDCDQLQAMLPRMANMVVARRLKGAPGMAELLVGQGIARKMKAGKMPEGELRTFVQEMGTDGRASSQEHWVGPMGQFEATADQAAKIVKQAEKLGGEAFLADQVADVLRMAQAKAVKVSGDRVYQGEAVGLHLATSYGYLNASGVGLGKTFMTLAAWREIAKDKPTLRAIVTCSKSLLHQWQSEANRFFPEANAVVLATKDGAQIPQIVDDATEAGQPLILITTYDSVRRNESALTDVYWDQVACDEAVVLANPSSGRAKALWALREACGTGVALTGTSVEKNIDGIGYMISWARGDRALFEGYKLSKYFDATDAEQARQVAERIGPILFRRDRSEIKDELPEIMVEPVLLDPDPAELKLAKGATDELKATLDNIEEKIAQAEALDPDNPKWEQAKKDLRVVRGSLLGAVTLARMAASDPLAVETSESAGAIMLRKRGLIEGAVKAGGTKRKAVSELTVDLVDRGESVLIFTEFASVAKSMQNTLAKMGLKSGLYSGDASERKRGQLQDDFQNGKLDVLVLTSAANEGLNLQRATVVVHLDLPWMPSKVVQRIGRAARIGNESDRLMVLIPLMAGTIEERVAEVLMRRAVASSNVLDAHRGVDLTQTEFGLALGGIADMLEGETEECEDPSIFGIAKSLFVAA